mgnify:CR=1 FL=1
MQTARQAFSHDAALAHTLNPYAVLARGYAVVQGVDNQVVRRAAQVQPGEALQVRLFDGMLLCTVDECRHADKTLFNIMAGAKKAVDFEAAQQKLEEILQRLSEDDVSLDESVTLYATASELIAQCSAALKNAELKVQEIDASLAQALGQQAQEGVADDV